MSSAKLIIATVLILFSLVCLEFLFMKFELFYYLPNIGIVFHILGGCCSGLLMYGICMENIRQTPILIQLVFVLGSAAIAAVAWECFEWGLGILLSRKMQGSINNIMLDLFTGMVGGTLACVLVWFKKK